MVRIAMLRAAVAAGAATVAVAQFTTPDPGCEVLDFVQEGWGAARNNVDGACSGHGTCANATCTCDEGWTGRADFLDTEGEDCAVFEPAVRAVWGINTLFILAYFGIGLPRVLLRWRQHQDAIHQKRAQGSSYSLRNNRGMMACLYMYSITFPALLSYGLLMQLDPSQRVGLDLNVTIAYAIARTGFYGSVWLFQPALLSTILRGSRATRHLVKVNDVFSFFLCLFAIGLGYMPFVTLAMSDGRDELALTVYYISTGGTWLFVLLLGIQAVYVKVKVTEVLERSYELSKHERTLRIKDALIAVQKENLFQATLQVSLYSLFLLWPFMYNKHCYMLPLSWIAYGILAKKLAFTTVSYESGSRTNMSTLQSKDNSKDYSRDVRSLDESAVQSSQAAAFTFKKAPLAPFSGPVRTPPPPPISTYKSYDSIQESDDDLV